MKTVEKMIPYFFRAGNVNYARYGVYYLRLTENLPEDLREQFDKGAYVIYLTAGLWNGIW